MPGPGRIDLLLPVSIVLNTPADQIPQLKSSLGFRAKLSEVRFMERLIKTKELCDVLAISRTTLWRWIRAGRIPQPKRIGASLYWRHCIIQEFMQH